MDLPLPLAGSLKEPFEIKVYEIDDVERLQRHRPPPREDPAEVRAGGGRPWQGRLAPGSVAGQPTDFTFPSCPQPSQDVEKVGTGSEPTVAPDALPWAQSGWLEGSQGHHGCSLELYLGMPTCSGPGSIGPGRLLWGTWFKPHLWGPGPTPAHI